jgi:hypothetical protein
MGYAPAVPGSAGPGSPPSRPVPGGQNARLHRAYLA